MEKFRDNKNREWTLDITVETIRRLRSRMSIDLLDLLGGNLAERLMRDPILLVDVVYVCCEDEMAAAKVTAEDFGRSMRGDPLGSATKALLDDVANFYQSPQDRANMQKILVKARQTQEVAWELAARRIDAIDPEALASQVLATAGPLSGDTPASLA